jgi:peroxiredoxin
MDAICMSTFRIRPAILAGLGFLAGLASAFTLPAARSADNDAAATTPSAQSAGHSAHGESFNEGPRSAAYLMPGTGNVHFPVTCKSDEAQKFFDQGLGQLHGFWYFESERSFRQAAAIDPNCAMAYWGMAMANTNNDQRARDFIKEAEKLKTSGKLKPIETAWIDAISAFYRPPPTTRKAGEKEADFKERQKKEREKSLVAKLKEMRKQFPDDVELKAFLALYIFEFHLRKENATADKLLDEIFAAVPNHPAHHYRIHLLDIRSPKDALASAAMCGPAAPGIAHMWHMPGHIYSDLNRYADAVWQQEAAARVDQAYMIHDRVMPFQIHNYMHNSEWLCRDLMNVGRAHDALELAKNMITLPRHPSRGGGRFYGTARAIDTLVQHEMWEEYLKLCADGTLSDDLDPDQFIRKLCYEGVADAALKHNDAADRCIARLKDQRKAAPPATTQPATKPAKDAPKQRTKKEAAGITEPGSLAPRLVASAELAVPLGQTLNVGRGLPAIATDGGQCPPYGGQFSAGGPLGSGPRTVYSGVQPTVRSERENLSEKSAAGGLTGRIAVLRTAGEGTGGTLVRGADPTGIAPGDLEEIAPDFTLCATATTGVAITFTMKLPVRGLGPAPASAITRLAAKLAATTRPATNPATRPAKPADTRSAIDQAIDHINAEKALVAGDFARAATLLTAANARKEHIALAYLAAKNFAKAEELAKEAVNRGKGQTDPLATLILVLHGAGKKAEAAKTFDALQKLAEAVDVTVEPYKSLCAIAPQYGYKTDFRIARKLPADIGQRPPLDSLGPFCWHPSPAPPWTAPSSSDTSLSLSAYRGKPVILLFYLGHGCPHCVKQIHDFAAMSKQFAAAGISLVGIGTDPPDLLGRTWTSATPAPAFPLVSDGSLDIFKQYHCYDAFEKMPLHGTFLIDAKGLVRWQDISYEPFLDTAFVLKEAKRLISLP